MSKEWGPPQLFLHDDKLVGVMKMYDSAMRESLDALVERFGKASPDAVTTFPSVVRPGGKAITGEQTLIRYCFPKCIVYGYVSSGDPSNFVKPFMIVGVFERNYLENVLKRDIEQKEKLLAASRPAIDYAFGNSLKWDAVPFPKVDGTTVSHGVNNFKEPGAVLTGRLAPRGTPDTQANIALFVHEQKGLGTKRAVAVTVAFNSFPSFQMHPLTAPRLLEGGVWFRSHGIWHVEQDAQRCNAILLAETFPPGDGKMQVTTVANPLILGMDGHAHQSMKAYSWETKERHSVQILSNNTVIFVKRG